MSVQFKYELTDARANVAGNLAGQFKHDIDNCNNGSIETRKRYHKALEGRFAKFMARDFRLENIKNIGPKHIYAYVRFLQENGKSAGYIMPSFPQFDSGTSAPSARTICRIIMI